MKYFNTRYNGVVETVEELDRDDFNSYGDFIKEVKRLRNEYRIAGMNVYTSQRCTKDWRSKSVFFKLSK